MSTGDLLFVFAFIVLPTVILVSCIWTLLLIRAGVLLPARRVVVADSGPPMEDTSARQPDDVETTMIHDAPLLAGESAPGVAGAIETPVVLAALPAPEPLRAIEPVIAAAEPTPVSEEPDSISTPDARLEQTTEFPIIDDAMLEDAVAEAATTDVEPGLTAPPIGQKPAEPAPAEAQSDTPASAPGEDLAILFVPLDEPPSADSPLSASNGAHPAERMDEAEETFATDEPGDEPNLQRASRSRRKPVRRVAQLRPSEEQSSSVSPMGSLLRRSRSGSSR